MKLYRCWGDLIVARNERDVKEILRDSFGTSRGHNIEVVTENIPLSFDGGDTVEMYPPERAVEICGHGIIPEH